MCVQSTFVEIPPLSETDRVFRNQQYVYIVKVSEEFPLNVLGACRLCIKRRMIWNLLPRSKSNFVPSCPSTFIFKNTHKDRVILSRCRPYRQIRRDRRDHTPEGPSSSPPNPFPTLPVPGPSTRRGPGSVESNVSFLPRCTPPTPCTSLFPSLRVFPRVLLSYLPSYPPSYLPPYLLCVSLVTPLVLSLSPSCPLHRVPPRDSLVWRLDGGGSGPYSSQLGSRVWEGGPRVPCPSQGGVTPALPLRFPVPSRLPGKGHLNAVGLP